MSGPTLHERLVDLLELERGAHVLDLGCGRGQTLTVIQRRLRSGRLVGVDHNAASLEVARTALASPSQNEVLPASQTEVELVHADLSRPIPLPSESFHAIVCHNVLECLADKAAFLNEVYRLLRPGGRLVLGHADFDTLVWNSSDLALTRRFVHHFADTQQGWMAAVDGAIGRKLCGLVARSPLTLRSFEVVVLAGRHPGENVHDFAPQVVEMSTRSSCFSEEDRRRWLADLAELDARGEYFFSLNNYVVVAERQP